MGTQQFCLKWNNHHSNMLAVFEQLLSSEALVDVTLACEGLSLKAHKMVLSACSPFFQSLFLENPCKHPIVILKDMRYTDLKAIIDFMYRGEVNVSQDQLSALLKTAETLKVKGLAEVTSENRQGNATGVIQQEIIQTAVPPSGAQQQHRAESPPLSRRKRGRPRRRSLSDSNRSDSEDQIPSKIKEPDSPEIIEDVNRDLTSDSLDGRQRLSLMNHPQTQVSTSQPPTVPHLPASQKSLPSIHSQDGRATNEEPTSGDEADFDVEPSKLMEQSMTTENVPVFPDGQAPAPTLPPASTQITLPSSSTPLVDTRQHHLGSGPAGDSQALVPVSLASDPSIAGHTSQDGSPDIKPGALVSYEEPPISPVAGPSHDNSSSMLMFMDTSGVPAIPGPSNYQPDKQSPTQQPSQVGYIWHLPTSQTALKVVPTIPLQRPIRPKETKLEIEPCQEEASADEEITSDLVKCKMEIVDMTSSDSMSSEATTSTAETPHDVPEEFHRYLNETATHGNFFLLMVHIKDKDKAKELCETKLDSDCSIVFCEYRHRYLLIFLHSKTRMRKTSFPRKLGTSLDFTAHVIIGRLVPELMQIFERQSLKPST